MLSIFHLTFCSQSAPGCWLMWFCSLKNSSEASPQDYVLKLSSCRFQPQGMIRKNVSLVSERLKMFLPTFGWDTTSSCHNRDWTSIYPAVFIIVSWFWWSHLGIIETILHFIWSSKRNTERQNSKMNHKKRTGRPGQHQLNPGFAIEETNQKAKLIEGSILLFTFVCCSTASAGIPPMYRGIAQNTRKRATLAKT